jgi:hypothetical protein
MLLGIWDASPPLNKADGRLSFFSHFSPSSAPKSTFHIHPTIFQLPDSASNPPPQKKIKYWWKMTLSFTMFTHESMMRVNQSLDLRG